MCDFITLPGPLKILILIKFLRVIVGSNCTMVEGVSTYPLIQDEGRQAYSL